MGLPHAIVELMDRAKIVGNERQQMEHRIHSILHNAYEKGRQIGIEEGYEKGLDDAFELAQDEPNLLDKDENS